MKTLCAKHITRELKNHPDLIAIIARLGSRQQLSVDDRKCKSGARCHNTVQWIVRYISELPEPLDK